MPQGRGEPRSGGGRGSRIPRPPRGQHPQRRGRRASRLSSIFSRQRAAVKRAKQTRRNKSERRRRRAAAPGRRRGEPGSGAAGAAAWRGSFKKRLEAKRAVELPGPGLSKSPCCCPGRPAPSAAPQQRAGSGRAPRASLSSHPQQQKTLPTGPRLQASSYPACTASVGLAPLTAPTGLAGRCGQCGQAGRGGRSPVPRGSPPPEVAAPQSLSPQRSGSGAQAGLSTK